MEGGEKVSGDGLCSVTVLYETTSL